ncbi:CD109 antigen-like [Lucilia cuprina]|uniref:CD109 antigen-like n=1 Tax=Lucilia cuprina TaxID=7375 RepID=UPI001F069A71|nr:CD109 antigen-like [Lucilia cuprina]
MGHATIVQMEHIKLPPNQKSYVINITASIDMIPDSFVYVYYVHKNNLRYEELQLNFPHEFENQITLSAPKQVKPGEDVTISINAQPKSYVSILAVDLGVSVIDKTYDLNKDEIIKDLVSVRSYSPKAATVYPGIISGLVTLTNAHYYYQRLSDGSHGKNFVHTTHKYRENFSETWIFEDIVINETNTKLTLPIPDAITTWRVTAFSNNNVTGFGIVDGPTDITTIQSFFITLNLPYSVKRGEIVTIPITIFNYSNQTLETEVVLHNNDQEFHFMESDKQDVINSNKSQHKIERINVPKDKAKTVNILIYPAKVGDVNLKATASSSLYNDAVVQKLKVEPEGVPKQKNQAKYLSIPAGEKIASSFSIAETVDSVPDSDYFTFSVGGHYLVPTVENFDDLIQMPTGCGEQNMVNLAPSILILQYLKANGKFSKEKALVENLLSSLEVSYQQQLSFRHDNGGYSVFGVSTDEEPSTWLTAYVVRYFIKASQFLSIEEKVIKTALEYLAGEQKSNGEFPYTGYLLNTKHQNEYGITAFILLAFLESEKYAMQYEETIQKGIEFLNTNLNNTNDLYVLSLMAIVLKRTNNHNANILINQLKPLAKENNELKWWSENDQNLANDIEITAYAALTLLETAGDHTSILKWLIQQRNANGGFTSSYDTVAGMEALVKFSETYKNHENINLLITYSAKDKNGFEVAADKFYVDSNNILDFQKHELPTNTRLISFEIEGKGAILLQLNHQYNTIAKAQEYRHFDIQPKPVFKNVDELNLEICFTYQTNTEPLNDISNMVIMEANLPSGFRSEAENSATLKNNNIVQLIEMKNSDSTVILYLEKLEGNVTHCLEIPAYKINEILMPKPAAIIMYDYYNLSRSNIEFYSI